MTTINPDLLFFNALPVQTDILASKEIDYHPRAGDNTGPLEFIIAGSSNDYIDLNKIDINIKFKILKADGSAIAAADKVGINNLGIATIFRDVTLYIGTKQIEGGQMDYAYKSYFRAMTQFHPSAQATHLKGFGWYKDEAGKFDDETNKGFIARQKLIEGSKVCELHGPVFLDFFNQSRPLINNVDVRLIFTIQKPEFFLNSFKPTSCKIEIVDATLYARRLKMNPSVIKGHMDGLSSHNAIYPVNHTELQKFSIGTGKMTFTRDQLFNGKNPRLVMIAMTTDKAQDGNYERNPFNFRHFNLSEITLRVGGNSVPGPSYQPDFTAGHYLRNYNNFMEALKFYNTDDTNGISPSEYPGGYFINVFDLTPDNDIASAHRHANMNKNMRLDLAFKTPTTETLIVHVFAVYDQQVEITKIRDVLPDYMS